MMELKGYFLIIRRPMPICREKMTYTRDEHKLLISRKIKQVNI